MDDRLKEIAMALLYADLGFSAKSIPAEIASVVESKLAQGHQRLLAAGITVAADEAADVDLLVCYAGWLYRSRINQQAMPLQLRRLLRDRQAQLLLQEA